ncbi:MAG TPA: glycogen/starch synthase [Pyrinomonadaceae bacterium]|jgi:starch synthase
MRVAVLASEAVPYSKTGGLGDVAGALPKFLKKQGADSVLITPFYQQQTKPDLLESRPIGDLIVDWRGQQYRCGAFFSERGGVPAFLIDAPEFFQRDSIYGFREDYLRYAFFSKAALALLKRIGAPPDIIHLNDWHTGFAAVEIADKRRWDGFFRNVKTVFSIHNLAYQGVFGEEELWKLGYGEDWQRSAFLANGAANAMKAGLTCSDWLSTVSRGYARETMGAELGNGLDWLLRERSNRYIGITNGIDYEEWNPAGDKNIAANYSREDLSGKRKCKEDLLRHFGLYVDLERPVFGWVSRLTPQKGVELLQSVAFEIVMSGCYFVALGSGSSEYENFLQALRDFAPRQVGVFKGYNEPLAHKIEAGSDMFLMPSKFEPCGLNQMYSLRYGTIPVVRGTGGLDDTVEEFDLLSQTGNGFKFYPYDANAFLEKIYEAIFNYADQKVWRRIQSNGMRVDNSWEKAANNYLQLYSLAMRS